MTHGPDIAVECPKCARPLLFRTYGSGNEIGTVMWSDGYHYQPFMPPKIEVAQCGRCRQLFWLEEARMLGYVGEPAPSVSKLAKLFGKKEAPEEVGEGEVAYSLISGAPYIEELDEDAAAEGVRLQMWQSHEEELELRWLWRWRFNDKFRGMDTPPENTAAMIANLERIYDLHEPDGHQINLIMGDIARTLGDFEKAEKLIGRAVWADGAPIIEIFEEAVRQHQRHILNLTELLEPFYKKT